MTITETRSPHSTNTSDADDRKKRRGAPLRVLMTVAVVLVGMATMTVTSLALFTDSADVGANTFAAGTIDITAAPATAVVTMSSMAPGDQVTNPLTVTNSGSLEFRYALTSATTEDVLASELVLTVRSGVATCDDANYMTGGTTLYTGELGSVATTAIFGDATPGQDTGDRVLAASANEVLCFNVTLPTSTTAGQGATTTATLSFEAEQTANNA